MRKLLFLSVIVFAFSIPACKKELLDNPSVQPNQELISRVNKWLDSMKPINKTTQSENVELLRSNLDFSALRIEQSAGNEKIIVVPVKEGLKQKKNLDEKAIPNLVLILDNMGNIRKGNLVLFYPKEGLAYNKVPDNTFYAILNTANPEAGGKFKYLSVTGKKLHELEYENGRLKSFANFKDSSAINNNARTNACVNWFWVTTYYDQYGYQINQTWEYIGTTCEGEDCQDPYNAMICPMSYEHVGSGGNEGYEFSVTKPVNWIVLEASNQFWYVKSYETLKGIKVAGEPGGGHFTSNVHEGDGVFNPVTPGYASWQKFSNSSSLSGDGALAYAYISGKVTFSDTSPDVEANNKFNVWAFFQEF